jgi:hypothetical protein
MDRLGYPELTIHGFRSTFRDWCAETGKGPEVAEASLAHKLGNKVATAYLRSDLLDLRRPLMEEWGEYLTRSAKAVPALASSDSRLRTLPVDDSPHPGAGRRAVPRRKRAAVLHHRAQHEFKFA